MGADEKTRKQIERLLPKEVVTENEFQAYQAKIDERLRSINGRITEMTRELRDIQARLYRSPF